MERFLIGEPIVVDPIDAGMELVFPLRHGNINQIFFLQPWTRAELGEEQ